MTKLLCFSASRASRGDHNVQRGRKKEVRKCASLPAELQSHCHGVRVCARLKPKSNAVFCHRRQSHQGREKQKGNSRSKNTERLNWEVPRERILTWAESVDSPRDTVNGALLFVGPRMWVLESLVWREVAPNTSQQEGARGVEVEGCQGTSSGFQAARALGQIAVAAAAAVVVAAAKGEAFDTGSLLAHGVPLGPVSRDVSA